jgi:hypothetical protein
MPGPLGLGYSSGEKPERNAISLPPGAPLGQYRIVALLGAPGMGEHWRTRAWWMAWSGAINEPLALALRVRPVTG